ncbi:hypothetical protein H5T54_04585 [Candidatus Bipolaricaulota bacterium]|nr:hypothetical protein [Candidatus Bipolaricaulota bacterium]
MTIVASKTAYPRDEARTYRDHACYLTNADAGANATLPWPIALPSEGLEGPAVGPWSEDSGAATVLSPLLVEALERLYGSPLSAEVIAFLEENPELLAVLFEAWQEVDLCLEAHPRMELRLSRDPEVEGLTMLYAIVHTTRDPKEVFRGLKALDVGWLSRQPPWIQELFNVDVEFD